MESSYQLSKVKGDGSNAVSRRAKLYEMAPIKEMIRRQWIQPTDNVDVLEKSVSAFLEPAKKLEYAARKSGAYDRDLEPSERAWLLRVKQLAEAMEVKEFSEMAFVSALNRLKTMLRDTDAVSQVPAVLAEAGVRFLIVETLPSTRIDGVCLWLNKQSPVIALSLRYDRIDTFWHTLLHECAHLKHGDALDNNVVVDIDIVGEDAQPAGERPPSEVRADEFAASFSIDKKELEGFIARVRPLFSKTRVQGLAAKLNVHPGLVVGQLQYRKMIPYSHSREMLSKVRHILTDVALTDGFGSIHSNAH